MPVAALSLQSAWAQQRPVPEVAAQVEASAPRNQRIRAMSESVRRVQRSVGGQVLGAERIQFDGRDITRVKVMDDRGRVRYVDDDPGGRAFRRAETERNKFQAPHPRAANPGRP